MLDALVRRAEYEAELDAMTPEQKAENDERLEKLKALIPLPAPSAAGNYSRLWRKLSAFPIATTKLGTKQKPQSVPAAPQCWLNL